MENTLIAYLNKGKAFLAESQKHDAEELLMGVCGIEERIRLFLDFEKPLTKEEIDAYRESLVRRKKGEPVQYILGESWFYGRKFLVNPDVLIPRLDSELLLQLFVEEAQKHEALTIFDIGTGSGILAVTGALELPNVSFVATDICEKALNVAKQNAQLYNVAERIKFIQSDLLENLVHEKIETPLLVVSNPPYIAFDDPHIESQVKNFEPAKALFAENQGLDFYQKIIQQLNFFDDNLVGLFFEIGSAQGQAVQNMLQWKYPDMTTIIKDIAGNDRVVSVIKEH